ncbi:hypothetical protein [Nocardioides sp. Leaf285]|uniref:hypothetical protein n=1 Tax=Nocardioides sp. Leaf285 TaxID=1736322 RepID=UPI000703935C|nr:hypothetical protein [Nocardioides sp. Leaf285]
MSTDTGRIRFVPKQVVPAGSTARSALWKVYDVQRACYPARTAELGEVAQDHRTTEQAQAECDRLSAAHGGVRTAAGRRTPAPAAD